MVNVIPDPKSPQAFAGRVNQIENNLAAQSTQPIGENIANGIIGGGTAVVSLDTGGIHFWDPNGNLMLTGGTASGAAFWEFFPYGAEIVGSATGMYMNAMDGASAGAAGPIALSGGLTVSGTKSFVMAHPTKPGWTLQHAATESPQPGVEYWGTATLDGSGNATVTLPAYFDALTNASTPAVLLTPQGTPAALCYTPIVSGVFTVQGPAGITFSWLVKAAREVLPNDWPIDFDVESPVPPNMPPTDH